VADIVPVTRFVPTPEQFAWTFGGCDPVMRVRPGEILDLLDRERHAVHAPALEVEDVVLAAERGRGPWRPAPRRRRRRPRM